MDIIDQMARHASHGCFGVFFINMADIAGDVHMLPVQWEICFGMNKERVFPAGVIVASGAIFTKFFMMMIILGVTAVTIFGSSPVRASGLMA